MTQPRHVKAFLKDDKIVFEINENPEPKDESMFYKRHSEDMSWGDYYFKEWKSQHQYIEGAEEHHDKLIDFVTNEFHKNHKPGQRIDVEGILIDPSIIEERNGFIYLKEIKTFDKEKYIEGKCANCGVEFHIHNEETKSDGQDELWGEVEDMYFKFYNGTVLKSNDGLSDVVTNILKSKFTITRK